MRHLHTLLLFLLPLASSCVVVASSERNPIVSTSVTLNKLVDEDGRQVQYDLWPSAGGAPSIPLGQIAVGCGLNLLRCAVAVL
jgi:hypothetical protein